MTVNFKNSAGTDLDNIFYTDNGNAGALGFKNSAGTDLGNLYTNKSIYGTSVGFKNSAGTDIGNLRGNTSGAPSSVSISGSSYSSNIGYCGFTDACGEQPSVTQSSQAGYSFTVKTDVSMTSLKVETTWKRYSGLQHTFSEDPTTYPTWYEYCSNTAPARGGCSVTKLGTLSNSLTRTTTLSVSGTSVTVYIVGVNYYGCGSSYSGTAQLTVTFTASNSSGSKSATSSTVNLSF